MKTMTCRQLGGACDLPFVASTFDEIAALSHKHGAAMLQQGDKPHMEAMNKMRELMQAPGGMQKWMEERRSEFDALPSNL
ncbi:MAG: DUF1059 domain-containing protein [Bacteroidia bacterium]|nr:DUF1059 domain-containing protein [Bacteroidia bacterium]